MISLEDSILIHAKLFKAFSSKYAVHLSVIYHVAIIVGICTLLND